jgi:DNA-binding XRE family transcriptional regulator
MSETPEAYQRTPENISKASCVSLAIAGHMVRKAIQREEAGTPSSLKNIADSILSSRISDLEPLEPAKYQEVGTLTQAANLWHGTGRYQYHPSGQIVDVLDNIARAGRIQTNYDRYDVETGPMDSISLARARMYGRAYADMHNNNSEGERPERHGSAIFWASVFVGDWALAFAREQGGYRNARDRMKEAGSDHWHAKINSRHLGIRADFVKGSDITGNYPILFGVEGVVPAKTSGAFALHEVRTCQPIEITTQITHAEVPRAKVGETQDKFAEYGLSKTPIMAIEDGERYAASQNFSGLLGRYFGVTTPAKPRLLTPDIIGARSVGHVFDQFI